MQPSRETSERWADKNLMQFNKERYRVLHLGRNSLRHQDMMGEPS